MKFLLVILDVLCLWPGPKNEPPDSLVGESKLERGDRKFWHLASWVMMGIAILLLSFLRR